MVKLKITRSDGTVIEAEGEADELAKLQLIPWQFSPIYPTVNPNPIWIGGGTIIGGGTWYQDADGQWKQK